MSVVMAVLASAAGVVGAWLFYLASPKQQWRHAGPWPVRGKWIPGSTLSLVSLAMFLSLMGSGAAFFTWLTILMLVWSAAPFLGVWRARQRGGAHGQP
ncbi:TPA: hypothetical protein ACOEN9_000021 [Stenotrophomonas maltophilia]|uniref:hypothetical protein n=1 Tax=Stenotrophomonas TaxID=40323 RepID=UPI000C151E8F|nr:hypothetical protein [Stenotrophomonas maltophilia]MBA0373637.1 hypothetical protein [Stenotrophomonas maltophilia]MBA0543600.1 hypothetical protein [Stenotrophomonas maltophilia]MBH1718896.1 hypothetical protein [Stenotrophomonas maltophilia]MBH1793239.1 hypothetical protein [Stenotrophomonas maltophilia]HDS1010383.1 hypothetical protein [Stenotrophomonas maltophilia]